MSFFQDLFLLSYEKGTIDENKFSVLHEELMSRNPDFSYEEHNRFSLEEMSDAEFSARYNLKRPSRYKFYPKNISESLHVDRNQKKMKYRVIFQLNSEFI